MLASFLTAFFFALSALFATRSARHVGAVPANFSRQWIAFGLLALWAHTGGKGWHGAGLPIFICSGIIGFGFGDLALFEALPRIGSRLTTLMVQCLAAPIAAALEWVWLGTRLSAPELLCGGVILAGVAVAVTPDRRQVQAIASHVPVPERALGLIFGLVAAVGQAGGAVLSRAGNLRAQARGELPVDGATISYQRLIGGLLVVSAAFLLARRRPSAAAPQWRAAWPWIAVNGIAGPVLGVSCYQWALTANPSARVLPIVALTPLLVIPFAFFMENERPNARSLLGGALAVAGAAGLAWLTAISNAIPGKG